MLFSLISCECINDINTPRENIPEQNSLFNLINLSSKNQNLDIYNNDIFIERLIYKNTKTNNTKYISGNSILNSRINNTAILVTPVSFIENEKYIGFIFDFNSSLNLIYNSELQDNNFRIWNLSNKNINFRIFSNNYLDNIEVPLKSISNQFQLINSSYQIIVNYDDKIIESSIQINSNKKYEIIVCNNELLTIDY
jgi:hypothetical protein